MLFRSGPNTDPELPLFPVPQTSTGGRLQTLMGLTRYEYLTTFERVNLLPYFPGQRKRDDKFPMTPAKLAARVIRPLLVEREVILVGRNVANAFGFGDWDWHEWHDWKVCHSDMRVHRGAARIVVIPHPSGRNHWYNNPENTVGATSFWAEFFGDEERSKKLLSLNDRRGKKTPQSL